MIPAGLNAMAFRASSGANTLCTAGCRPSPAASFAGRPFLTPLWFVADGGTLYLTTGRETRAARNVPRHPEVTVLLGGERLRGGVFDQGHFVAPTIARLPLTSTLYREELFVPFLAVGEVSGLDEAIARANDVEYGLTAGIFSADPAEVERFFDEVEAGVCYANKRSGATTGAWPGAQAFCGWKGSGSTGKGGCGPYYVAQFMREQNRTVIET